MLGIKARKSRERSKQNLEQAREAVIATIEPAEASASLAARAMKVTQQLDKLRSENHFSPRIKMALEASSRR